MLRDAAEPKRGVKHRAGIALWRVTDPRVSLDQAAEARDVTLGADNGAPLSRADRSRAVLPAAPTLTPGGPRNPALGRGGAWAITG
jgi:hypothetical protein